jgi:CubicO group peptidase (beta-lactamase class C family)
MSDLDDSRAERLQIRPDRLKMARDLIEAWACDGEVIASAVVVGRSVDAIEPRIAGRVSPDHDSAPLARDSLFLAASLTKPVIAVATMLLVERGGITLDDRIVDILPEFGDGAKADVRLRHLLTHTSGLPDQLPNNEELRARHAPLSEFVAETCRRPLLFAPGTAVRYQSMGFAILGALLTRLTGRPLPEFLRDELFGPLGMLDTTLGLNPRHIDRQTVVRIDATQSRSDWHWNSPYWRGLGSPWGGMITSASDYGRFLRMMLGRGSLGPTRLLSPATVETMIANQLLTFPGVPDVDRRLRPWGLGWRLRWPGSSAHFGDLLGPRSFGHWGATGTVAWADPDRDAFAVILTTEPQGEHGSHLARLSNVLASAFE